MYRNGWLLNKQESCAIAKMTARCALYMSASYLFTESDPQQGLVCNCKTFGLPKISPCFDPCEEVRWNGGWPLSYWRPNCPCN